MCRSGRGGAGSSCKFTFDDYGGEKKAWKAAQVWLKDMMAEFSSQGKRGRRV